MHKLHFPCSYWISYCGETYETWPSMLAWTLESILEINLDNMVSISNKKFGKPNIIHMSNIQNLKDIFDFITILHRYDLRHLRWQFRIT